MRLIAKILVGMLCIFGATSVISYFIGYSVTFPFNISDQRVVPDHRLHAVRLATFTSFVYFGIRYIFFTTTKLYPIQFLDIYMKFFTISGLFVFYSMNVEIREYYFIFFIFIVSLILHFASRKKIKNLFN